MSRENTRLFLVWWVFLVTRYFLPRGDHAARRSAPKNASFAFIFFASSARKLPTLTAFTLPILQCPFDVNRFLSAPSKVYWKVAPLPRSRPRTNILLVELGVLKPRLAHHTYTFNEFIIRSVLLFTGREFQSSKSC